MIGASGSKLLSEVAPTSFCLPSSWRKGYAQCFSVTSSNETTVFGSTTFGSGLTSGLETFVSGSFTGVLTGGFSTFGSGAFGSTFGLLLPSLAPPSRGEPTIREFLRFRLLFFG